MEELRGYFAVHSQGLGHATRAVALARGLMERRRDLYLLFLAGSPALGLVVASGLDALTMPPAPDWQTTDGGLDPVWGGGPGHRRKPADGPWVFGGGGGLGLLFLPLSGPELAVT